MNSSSAPKSKVYLETFGCQMNILDSELVQNQLSALDFEFIERPENADIVLYNTCSVRDLSEQKVLSRLGVMREQKIKNPDLIVGVLGCMAERASTKLLSKNPHIDLLVGPSKLDEVPGLLNNLLAENRQKKTTEIALSDFKNRKGKKADALFQDNLESMDLARLSAPQNSQQAFVRITRGCNKFCAFCVVPKTRGPEVHRSADAILKEVQILVAKGVKEITLLGQTINHYQSHDTSFAMLLKRIHDENPKLARLRFLTSYPRDFTDEALDVMAQSPRICKYLHIPAQSGSNDVLKRMNRGYTREVYMDLIKRAKERMPGLAIHGDMIVGFPGETEEDFEASLSLLREVKYKNIFVFKYSPRPGTVSEKKDPDDIPMSLKKDRNQRMLAVQREISEAHHNSFVGQTVSVLVERRAKLDPATSKQPKDEKGHPLITLGGLKKKQSGVFRLSGRTEGDHIVNFNGTEDLIGSIVPVTVEYASPLSLKGQLSPS